MRISDWSSDVCSSDLGKPVSHGHFTVDVKGDRFALPCIRTNPIVPAPGAEPYASRLWQFPIDDRRTQVVRFITWRARTAEERSEGRRVGKEGCSTGRSRGSVYDEKIKIL